MKKQRVMSQVKGQHKTPEKQLNEVEIDNLSDSEDGPGTYQNNQKHN